MVRQYRCVLAALLLVVTPLFSEGSAGQSEAPPPEHQNQPQNQPRTENRRSDHERRMWWKDPKVIAELRLTPDQSAAIDGIFKTEIEKMKPLRQSVDQLERDLSETIRANAVDVPVFRQQVEKIEKKRAELNTMRLVMLYRIRRVLTADQNAKLHAMWDRERKQDDRRR